MNLATNRTIFFLTVVTAALMISAGLLNTSYLKPRIVISKQVSAINFNNDLLILFSSGQKRMLSDLFWIITLLESDIEHYKSNDLNSWLYLRFKTILFLDPNFLSAYRFAGNYLSIIKDDLNGAKEIFDLGLKRFPNDYELLLNAAFLYAFELNDYKVGSALYKKLSTFPQAPDYTKSLANKLDHETHNDLELTFKVVYELWNKTSDKTHLKEKLFNDLYSIRAELDIKCLNENRGNCNRIDYFGNPYIFNNNEYHSQNGFKRYRFQIKK
jgi:hypothetical protein